MNAEFHKQQVDRDCWVTYNPYKHDTFIQRTGVCDDKYPIPVTESGWAKMYILEGKPTVYAVNQKVHVKDESFALNAFRSLLKGPTK